MSLVRQIEEKGAVVCWSPLAEHAELVALGTKDSSGVGFDDHGGELDVQMLDFVNSESPASSFGKAKVSSRFSSIAWSNMANYSSSFPYGLIAGGMADGTINVWNPAKLSGDGEEALLVSIEQHQGAIPGLHFNSHRESSHLLASGGSDGEVYVISLDNPDSPSVFVPAPPPSPAKHTADITQVAWNSQVVHILASAAQNGTCYIWDLRQKRAWCELRDPSGGSVADIAWNPEQGLHIVTASGDDRNPVIKLWDLRSSTSLPLATLQGHTEGVLSVSWCPSDTSLLLSCGKDNRTILWDLFHLQPVYELPFKETSDSSSAQSDQNVFGSFVSSAAHRRYHVAWSPSLPAVISAASFDRRVQFFSMTGAQSKVGRAPKWLRRPACANFGFGGKLVRVMNSAATTNSAANKKVMMAGKLQVLQVEEDTDLVTSSDLFHILIGKGQFKEFCEQKSSAATGAEARKVWSLMNVICFGTNAREELLTYLGFDSATIAEAAKKYLSMNPSESSVSLSATDLFGGSSAPQEPSKDKSTLSQSKMDEVINMMMSWEEAEPTIRRAVVVGNFEMAVDCCLAAGLLAEALLLAQCGDHELRARTQAAFFDRQRNKHPFLNILHTVIKSQLMDFVLSSDLNNWQETLALLSTYGKSEEFSGLCEALANRLETEAQDKYSAALCFMCAANVPRTIKFWTEELQEANNKLGQLDTNALQDYVEKIIVFTQANPCESLGPECGQYFARYGELLVNQGRLSSAATYLKGSSTAENVLMDRIYHAGSKPAGSRPPPFPFTKIQVEASKAGQGATQGTSAVPGHVNQPSNIAQQQNNTRQQISASNSALPEARTSTVASPAVTISLPLPPSPASPSLPPGWLQLFDPSSNRPYYVNQATGQSHWEPPVPVAPPSPAVVPATSSTMSTFTPSLTSQNSQTLQPMMASQTIQASAAVPDPAPAATTTAPMAQTASTLAPQSDTVIALGQMIEAVAVALVSAQDKKQLAMVRTSYTALNEKLKQNQFDATILQKLTLFVEHMSSRSFASATAIQTDLVNTAWNDHKEWVKGLKILIQLMSKK